MGWIKNRIDAEYKKHKKLDWSKIAEDKIKSTIKTDVIDEVFKEEFGENNPEAYIQKRLKERLEVPPANRDTKQS